MASLAELLKRGKKITPFEQADFIARLGASLPENVGGLGLPLNNTSMERANALDYDINKNLYHGTPKDFEEFLLNPRKNLYASDEPQIADIYATALGRFPVNEREKLFPNILPLIGKKNLLEISDVRDGNHGWGLDNLQKALNSEQKRNLIKDITNYGYDGVKITNMIDLGGEQNQFVYPKTNSVRSRFAAFDPFRKNEANLLASHPSATLMAAGGLAGMARSALNEPYDPTNQYAKYGLKSPITRGEALKNAVGALPGIGEVMSGVDALAAAESGDWKSAGLSALGAAPMLGAIKASHGSPHLFDRFDFSKIGTGEGAQAYGHGGYFAQGFDSPVAKQYRDQLAADVQLKGQPFYSGKTGKQMATTGNQELDDYLLANLGDVSAARSNLLADLRDIRSSGGDFKDYQKTLANLRNIRGDVEIGNTGHLYNVELKWPDAAREAADPLGEQHLLDWDAPLSEQPINAQNALKSMVNDVLKNDFDLSRANRDLSQAFNVGSTTRMDAINDIIKEYPHLTYKNGSLYEKSGTKIDDRAIDEWIENKFPKGYENFGQLYRDLSHVVGNDAAISGTLNNWGIPGIKYLNASSRGTGTGSRNYVMFDDRFPTIVTRNGISLTDLLRNK